MSLARSMSLLLVILLADSPFVHSQARPTDKPESVHFRAGYFATPIRLENDPVEREVTAIEVSSESLGSQGGEGIFCVDQSTIEFDDFGDVTVKQVSRHEYEVTFVPLAAEDFPDERRDRVYDRRLYKIGFHDGIWVQCFILNLSNNGTALPRLVQRDPNGPGGVRFMSRVFTLVNLRSEEPKAGEPLDHRLSLQTGSLELEPGKPTGGIILHGALGGDGKFCHNDNHVTYRDFGDGGGITLRGIRWPKTKMVERDLEDPLRQGRRLYDLKLLGRTSFFDNALLDSPGTKVSVVVSPLAAGYHRLIIKQGEKFVHVLPLINDRRAGFKLQRGFFDLGF